MNDEVCTQIGWADEKDAAWHGFCEAEGLDPHRPGDPAIRKAFTAAWGAATLVAEMGPEES